MIAALHDPGITIVRAGPEHDWAAIRELVTRAFAFMEGRIDPPSSLHRMSAADFHAQAEAGSAYLAHLGETLAGCVFCKPKGDALYVGKLAVDPGLQGRGIGRALMAAAEADARARSLMHMELETRIELNENCQTFMKMGFIRTGQTAHPGYDRPTSITMRKPL